MKHEIKDNIYYLYDENNNILLQIELTNKPNNQIIISTDKEVFAGPVDFIQFSS